MSDPAAFHIQIDHQNGIRTISVSGVIDENSDLSFFEHLDGPTRFNLRNVRRINSYGVRAWIEGIRAVPDGVPYELVECPPSVVDQINMVAGFTGRGRVVSFYVPMLCESCQYDEDHLFYLSDLRKHGGRLPPLPCASCGTIMQVDDLEEQYLLFAREGT